MLTAAYHSFHPALCAGVGAILALLAFQTEFSIIAMIGVILLIGIVKKNAFMMIDFVLKAELTKDMSPDVAIFIACTMPFRPIMMTTSATLLAGATPLHSELVTGQNCAVLWALRLSNDQPSIRRGLSVISM